MSIQEAWEHEQTQLMPVPTASLYTLRQILSVTVVEKTSLQYEVRVELDASDGPTECVQFVAEAKDAGGPGCGLQDLPDFGFRAAAVTLGLCADGAMHIVGDIADRHVGHLRPSVVGDGNMIEVSRNMQFADAALR